MAAKHQMGAGSTLESGDAVLLSGRYRLHCHRRIPALDSPQAEAYEAVDLHRTDSPVFALLCRPNIVPRIDLIARLQRLKRAGLVVPLASGGVDWPGAAGRRLAVVLSRPGGPRLAPLGELTTDAMAPRAIIRQVLRPLAPSLRDLSERIVPHRAVRADNMFFRDASRNEVQLGDCISAPPGYDQPVIYEPLHHAMSDPAGRGFGSLSDDLYALGVTIALLLAGRNPCDGLSDAQIIAAKLRYGSFSTLMGDGAVPLELIEPLRGLLCDDPKQRWELTDLLAWLDGRRLSPKTSGLPPKASRPFAFKGTDYWDARSLAHALAQDWSAAVEVMNQGQIFDWRDRALAGPSGGSRGSGPDKRGAALKYEPTGEPEDVRLAQLLIALDPHAPIRLGELSVHVEGLGQALAAALHDTGRIRLLTKLLRGGLVGSWLDAQESNRPEHLVLRQEVEQATIYLAKPQLGYGLERALYRLNPDCSCRSAAFADDHVGSLSDLLLALERLAAKGTTARDPLDRHIAAFCLARAERLPEQAMRDLGSAAGSTRSLAMLRVLATIQADVGPDRLPALAQWFAQLSAAKIEEFHNRALRRELAENVERLAGSGNLKKLAALFDDQMLLQNDLEAFEEARATYRQTSAQIDWLEKGGLSGRDSVARTSRQTAGMLSAMLSGLMLIAMTLVYML